MIVLTYVIRLMRRKRSRILHRFLASTRSILSVHMHDVSLRTVWIIESVVLPMVVNQAKA